MVVYGGRGYQYNVHNLSPLSDVWSFSFKETSWKQLISAEAAADGPGERSSHSCVLMPNSDIMIFGGIVGARGSANQRVVNDLWRMALSSDKDGALEAHWERVLVHGDSPSPRFDHTAVLFKQTMIVYGGCVGSDAYADVWMLDTSGGNGFAEWYSWRQLKPLSSSQPLPTTLPFPSTNATDASGEGEGAIGEGTPLKDAGKGGAEEAAASEPGARCAHVAVPHPNGMLVFGGRIPLSTTLRRREVSWLSLADTWLLQPEAAAKGFGPWRRITQDERAQAGQSVLLNRSDHAGVLRRGTNLLVFGGLYTDTSDDTIYIMKDFLSILLRPAASLWQPPTATAARLEWGPAWRFDHSMVLAPSIDLSDSYSKKLADAPVLFGGGSGMDIFGDVWVYDSESDKWLLVEPSESASAAATFISSLLFGTAGFVIYTCVIICVFMRKISRSRRDNQSNFFPDHEVAHTHGGAHAGRRNGVSQEFIDALPRVAWKDAAKSAPVAATRGQQTSIDRSSDTPSAASTFAEVSSATSKAEPQGARAEPTISCDVAEGQHAESSEQPVGAAARPLAQAAAPTAGTKSSTANADNVATPDDAGADDEICSVCLSAYDAPDVLIRLPCNHLFHENCISRWLQQDGSCPQCRFNVRLSCRAPPSMAVAAAAAAAPTQAAPTAPTATAAEAAAAAAAATATAVAAAQANQPPSPSSPAVSRTGASC